MEMVNVHAAKTHLSRLLRQVEDGQEVVIARDGTPIAKLVRFERPVRKPGALEGKIWIGPDFDDPLPPEMREAFGMDP